MPRLSIIISHTGNAHALEDTLVSVLERQPDDSEVLMALHAPYENPWLLDREVRFVDATSCRTTVEGINLAIRHAQGQIVHLLTPGTLVEDGWADRAMGQFQTPAVAVVCPRVVGAHGRDDVLTDGVRYRREGRLARNVVRRATSNLAGLAPHTAAGFYRKAAMHMVGYFSDQLGTRLAGVDMSLALAHIGWRIVSEPECRVRLACSPCDPCAPFTRGRQLERLFWRWLIAGDSLQDVPTHLGVVLRECWDCFPSPRMSLLLLGRLTGMLESFADRGYSERLDQLRQAVESIPGIVDTSSPALDPFAMAQELSQRAA